MFKVILSVFVVINFVGCTHLESVSTSSIPKNRNNKVTATAEKMIFLGLNFSNDYVNGLAKKLAQQCPKGKVKGILTKHESIMYFLFFLGKVKVTAEGYCVK